jgi:hypothetical protein
MPLSPPPQDLKEQRITEHCSVWLKCEWQSSVLLLVKQHWVGSKSIELKDILFIKLLFIECYK